MVKRDVHWLDQIGQELWDDVHADSETAKSEIQDKVPLGTVSLLPEEQLTKFLEFTPEQLGELQRTVGPEEFQSYVSGMQKIMREKLGPMAKLFKIDAIEDAGELIG